MKKIFILLILFSVCEVSLAQKKETLNYKNGTEVIKAMYNAYKENKWYKNFTFSQETHFLKDGKEEKMEIWYEAATFPGKLLIKFNTKDSKNGILFLDQKVYGFTEGKKQFSKPKIHELLLGAFDVYFYKPEKTAHIFDSLGYDLKVVREDIFAGRKVIVVGAQKNDSTGKQFWIDSERFYLHRIVYSTGNSVTDCIFSDYEKIKTYWVAKTIFFKQNGLLSTIEKYYDIKFPKELDPALFDPAKFNEVKLD